MESATARCCNLSRVILTVQIQSIPSNVQIPVLILVNQCSTMHIYRQSPNQMGLPSVLLLSSTRAAYRCISLSPAALQRRLTGLPSRHKHHAVDTHPRFHPPPNPCSRHSQHPHPSPIQQVAQHSICLKSRFYECKTARFPLAKHAWGPRRHGGPSRHPEISQSQRGGWARRRLTSPELRCEPEGLLLYVPRDVQHESVERSVELAQTGGGIRGAEPTLLPSVLNLNVTDASWFCATDWLAPYT